MKYYILIFWLHVRPCKGQVELQKWKVRVSEGVEIFAISRTDQKYSAISQESCFFYVSTWQEDRHLREFFATFEFCVSYFRVKWRSFYFDIFLRSFYLGFISQCRLFSHHQTSMPSMSPSDFFYVSAFLVPKFTVFSSHVRSMKAGGIFNLNVYICQVVQPNHVPRVGHANSKFCIYRPFQFLLTQNSEIWKFPGLKLNTKRISN